MRVAARPETHYKKAGDVPAFGGSIVASVYWYDGSGTA